MVILLREIVSVSSIKHQIPTLRSGEVLPHLITLSRGSSYRRADHGTKFPRTAHLSARSFEIFSQRVRVLRHERYFQGTTCFIQYTLTVMVYAFDKCKERPAHIDQILNGLDRYNPETTTTFQEYVNLQCEEKFFDVYACLALLKL